MQLLKRTSEGTFALHEFAIKDTPAYAILSHTWSENNNEEVNFQDVESGTGKSKSGWRKLDFCADKAVADGLCYFWIDTCCIDKRNSTELSKAINSMFRWYRNAARCYVYLVDVSAHNVKDMSTPRLSHWKEQFKESRWFTRGWTLQELLAPRLVDFFSVEGELLGSKLSLEDIIHEITDIPKRALGGEPLESFSCDERMSWAMYRRTKEEEDEAYSLLGIFDVSMPLIYGEGKKKAYRRLREEIEKIHRGNDSYEFTITFDLLAVPEAARFVAREAELAEMFQILEGYKNRTTVVLHGLGGIGKTQLAIEYINRHKGKHTAVFWFNANDEDSLKSSFRDVAQQILEEHVPGNLDGWSMDIRPFLPRCDHGSIIITTRSAQVSLGHRIHVKKLPNINESLAILKNTSGRESIEDDRDALALAKELDGMPLALSVAGAYLERVNTSFADYLKLYKESWLKLQTTSPQLNSYADRSLYTTWQITFDRIKQHNVGSATLLTIWAYFDRQDLWFDLLRNAKSTGEEWLQPLTDDILDFNEAISLLYSFGLVDAYRSPQQQLQPEGYSVHSCVHSWTVFVLNKEWSKDLARVAFTCVASMIPDTDEKNWSFLQRRLLQHARYQDLLIEGDKVDVKGLHWAFHKLGDLFADQAKFVEAEKMYSRALQGKEETIGPGHPSTLDTANNLGNLYKSQGKLTKAEELYIRALNGYENTLGLDHISALNTFNNLGNLYRSQGKLDEAERMYVRALRGKEAALGADHVSIFDTVNNLGLLFADQGKLEEAEGMYIRALKGYELALGSDHTSIFSIANNLGNLYRIQGKPAEAEKWYIQALQGKEEALGPDHISTLDTAHNIGIYYANQGKFNKSEEIMIRALQGCEETLGLGHTSTLNTVNSLGNLYAKQGRLAEAEKMYFRALQGQEEALGSAHTTTLDTVHNLGALYATQGKLAEAEKMYFRAMQGQEKALGPDHTTTLDTVHNLGALYATQGKLADAESMYTRALQGCERALGLDHTSTLLTVNNLGLLYATQGKLAEAENMYLRALQGYDKTHGRDHLSSLDTVHNLGLLYATQKKLVEAENMYAHALQSYEKVLGDELIKSYPPALRTMFAHGNLYAETDRKELAKSMYTRALSGYQAVHGPNFDIC